MSLYNTIDAIVEMVAAVAINKNGPLGPKANSFTAITGMNIPPKLHKD